MEQVRLLSGSDYGEHGSSGVGVEGWRLLNFEKKTHRNCKAQETLNCVRHGLCMAL
jgi:hypothetical protein